MNILVYIGSMSGVAMHRLLLPYMRVARLTDEIRVEFLPYSTKITPESLAAEASKYDAFVFSRMMPDGWVDALKGRTKIICDTDDYWVLGGRHPLYRLYKEEDITSRLIHHMEAADSVCTTTALLASLVRRHNPNVWIAPNALSAEGQFARDTSSSERLRVGVIGGNSHVDDMEVVRGMHAYLTGKQLDRVQFVLAGFNHNAEAGDDSPWIRMERILSDDYRGLSEEHTAWLKELRNEDDPFATERYRRLASRPIESYGTLYNDIDVLLVPLKKNNFNKYKSPLKMIEASAKGKAVIVPNIHPYRDIAVSGGNCLTVDIAEGAKAYARKVAWALDHPDKVRETAVNLQHLTDEGGLFNLDFITSVRIKKLLSL